MKKAIGIDLGTTNSVVAFKDTVVKIQRNNENEELTRSCVGLRLGEILVGTKAYIDIKRDQINTILSIKRLMGGAIKDKMVQEMINSPYYKFGITALVGGTDDAVAVVLGGKQYTPEQISSEILKKLKRDAEEKLGDEVTHAVITVPAYFTEKQKYATRVAAQLAGLKVQKLLSEPTAAAIAYGVDNMQVGDSKTVLVYDFGGGTFDLSILNIVDGEYMEACTGGDRWLGGDDIDRKLQETIVEKVSKQYNISDLKSLISKLTDKKRILFEGEMRIQTENAKIQLSSAKSAQIIIDNILVDDNGEEIDINVTITRVEFENLASPFIKRSIELIETLLNEVGYDISMIDSILLVGGTSCIPLVKQMLLEKFGTDKIKLSEKPMLAIAEGAAIFSHKLTDSFECFKCGNNVLPNQKKCENCGNDVEDLTTQLIGGISFSVERSYYLETIDGSVKKYIELIEKQTPLPFETTKTFKTTTNNQKFVKVAICAPVEDGLMVPISLGYYLLSDNLPIESDLVFEFYMDTDKIFKVTVYPKGKKNQSKQIILGRGNADQKALQAIDDLIARSVKEYKTADGEEELMNYISMKIEEIETKGATEIEDKKWHEIYYTSTEKFDEIKSTEQGYSVVEYAVFRATLLINELGELLDQFDKTAMVNLITQIEFSEDKTEKMQLANELKDKTDVYGWLNSALRIESFADRILNIPGTPIGITNKQTDVNKLIQLYVNVKTKLKMNQFEAAIPLIDEAYEIIGKYKGSL